MTSRQLQYYAKQYEALSHFQETMRKERHERKNRNMELLMLSQKGDFDSLICRLNEEQSLMTPHSSTTGNRTVDAVLDFEKAVAREKKIEVGGIYFHSKRNGGGGFCIMRCSWKCA